MRIRWAPAAAAELQNIIDYLKERDPRYRAPLRWSEQRAALTHKLDGWQRNQSKFMVDNANDIRLLWKMKTDNKPMGMQ